MILRKFFGGKKETKNSGKRNLVSVCQLLPGDLVTFKHRQVIPPALQGSTLEITTVGTYQYDDGQYLELSLVSENKTKYLMGVDPQDIHADFDLSISIPRNDVLTIFDADDFSDLWDEDIFSELVTQRTPSLYEGWLDEKYVQTICNSTGYFHNRDCRNEQLSVYEDDGSEEFRYHEAQGINDSFTITVEVWGDGETDVTADVTCPSNTIENLWPGN